MDKSAKRLLILTHNLDGFSLVRNSQMIHQIHQIFSQPNILYGIL